MTPATSSSLPTLCIAQRLQRLATQQPDKVLFTHLLYDDKPPLQFSSSAIWHSSCAVAALLAARALQQRPVLLLYAAGPHFTPAFFGTLLAGSVAVPVPVPQFSAQYERLGRIVADCQPGAILSTVEIQAKVLAKLPEDSPLRACPWLVTDAVGTSGNSIAPSSMHAAFTPQPCNPAALALLQYTSGSTSEPKGVALTHANLAHNLDMLAQAFQPVPAARIVSWLPHFHDMGLVTGIMGPLTCGGESILMSPLAFLHRPLRWLQAISDYRGHISGAPNFAYELCVKWAQREARPALDLGSWQSAFAGAEPVRMATLAAFADCFARDGFRRTALTPCYGMAEATLLVSCKAAGTMPAVHTLSRAAMLAGRAEASQQSDALLLTGCGLPASGTDLRIVDPQQRVALPPDHIGEVWIAGPQVARGYWNAAADNPFGATLPDAEGQQFLRTGDLGYLTPDGEFVFVDRLKDLVIINGQNHACHDLELTVGNSHAQLAAENCVAVSLDTGSKPQLIVVAEFSAQALADADAVASAIRASLFSRHELAVHSIVLVPPRKLCRTTSGKLQRRLTAQRLIDGSLRVLAHFGEPLPTTFIHQPSR